MTAFFVDTWFLIARLDRSDAHHKSAKRLAARLGSAALVTHDAVLTEFFAFFSGEGPEARAGAVRMVREVVFGSMDVIPADRSLFIKALDLYARRPDKEYSLTDCMSMVVMRERGIEHVLTNDHHFRQEGFTPVSE